jgi:predicted transcriptional regulator
MRESNTDTPIDDIAYLARSEHRAPTLIALTVRPRSRSELWEMTGVSESTIRRTLSEFEDRDWVSRDGYQYEVTQLGAFVASAMANLIDRIETERKLRDVWRLLPDEESGFTIDMCSDATVTVADPENPSRPITRFCSLIEETDQLRFTGLDVAMLDSCKNELCQKIIDGMETELINPPRVADYIRSNCPDLFSEALESGNLNVRLHDELPPFGVSIFDDRIAITGYDPEGVTVRVLVDTDAKDAREWAESTFTSHRRKTPTLPLENDL